MEQQTLGSEMRKATTARQKVGTKSALDNQQQNKSGGCVALVIVTPLLSGLRVYNNNYSIKERDKDFVS